MARQDRLYFVLKGETVAVMTWRHRKPNRNGKWVFVLSNVDRLSDATDRQAFRVMAGRKLAKPRARISDLEARLGPEGLYALLRSRDPQQVPRLIAGLLAAMRVDLDALTLANKHLSRLKARLILVHGRKDRIIPYTESVALTAAARPGQAKLLLLHGLAHVDVWPSLGDRQTLWGAWRLCWRSEGRASRVGRNPRRQSFYGE